MGFSILKKFYVNTPLKILGKNYSSFEDIVNCDTILKWHALVRQAIDLGLIKHCPSSIEEFHNILDTYINNNIQVSNDDIIELEKLKCIIHPSYKTEDNNDEVDSEDNNNQVDLALCTSYKQNSNLPKYELKFIKDVKDLEGKKLISVSFGGRNTTDVISNAFANKQAFNVFVESYYGLPHMLASIEGHDVSIHDHEKPFGNLQPGDSGGTLLYKNDDDTVSLIAAVTLMDIWVILDPQFLSEAYQQLIEKASSEIEKTEL